MCTTILQSLNDFFNSPTVQVLFPILVTLIIFFAEQTLSGNFFQKKFSGKIIFNTLQSLFIQFFYPTYLTYVVILQKNASFNWIMIAIFSITSFALLCILILRNFRYFRKKNFADFLPENLPIQIAMFTLSLSTLLLILFTFFTNYKYTNQNDILVIILFLFVSSLVSTHIIKYYWFVYYCGLYFHSIDDPDIFNNKKFISITESELNDLNIFAIRYGLLRGNVSLHKILELRGDETRKLFITEKSKLYYEIFKSGKKHYPLGSGRSVKLEFFKKIMY